MLHWKSSEFKWMVWLRMTANWLETQSLELTLADLGDLLLQPRESAHLGFLLGLRGGHNLALGPLCLQLSQRLRLFELRFLLVLILFLSPVLLVEGELLARVALLVPFHKVKFEYLPRLNTALLPLLAFKAALWVFFFF